MKKYIKILSFIFMSVFLFNCGGKKSEASQEESHASEEEQHNEEEEGFATLTEAQIKEVGVILGPIEKRQLTGTLQANGFLRVPNDKKANATAMFGGVVQSLRVQQGDIIRKGQVIATIANPQFVQLQEDYLTTKSDIVLAEQELQRQKELFEGNAGAKKNLQNATANLNSLHSRKASLEKQIQLMGINPRNVSNSTLRTALTVTSPISGTVSEVWAAIGSYVDVSSPVAEIVDNSALHLDLQVFEKDLPKIKIGQIVNFTLTNNQSRTFEAKVFSLGTSFEPESRTISVHCNVIGPKNGMIDGMNVTGMISTDDVYVDAVPNDAIIEGNGKFYVFILANEQKEEHNHEGEHKEDEVKSIRFERVEVAKGISNMGYMAITPVTAIPKEAKVVTKGAFFINAKMNNTGGHAH